MQPNDLLLPPGTRLLHIGPHKTGTTALQGSLMQGRPAMAEHGVVYAGRRRQHWYAALAAVDGKGMRGDKSPSVRTHWETLVRQVERAGDQRVIISSEAFSEADDTAARNVVQALGGPRVHVLVTLRPLSKIMPSAWQQYVRNLMRVSYEDWLDGMLRKPPYDKPTTTFWKRHAHDALVARWAAVVGPENLTVAVVDDSDRMMLMRTVEQLVGLPAGLLEPEQGGISNRSLTHGETELVRRLNIAFRARGWSEELYAEFVRKGVVQHLQSARSPGPDEPRIVTPEWALARAAEIGTEAAQRIRRLGVRVIGDLAVLGAQDLPDDADGEPDPSLPPDAASEAVVGAVLAHLELLAEEDRRRGVPERAARWGTRRTRRMVRRARRRLRRTSR